MRQALLYYANVLALFAGCGETVANGGSETASQGGVSSASTAGGETATTGGSNSSESTAGGETATTGGSNESAGGEAPGASCQDLQAQAQQAADLSCQVDSDCIHPPHSEGDCTECGVELNAAAEQASMIAVRAVCQRFYAQGCQIALHSCFAQKPACNAGVCDLSLP